MRRFIGVLFLLVLFAVSARGQFSASGGSGNAPFTYTSLSGTGLDKVFVYNGAFQASLSFAAADPSDWTWYRFTSDPNAAVAVGTGDIEVTASSTTVKNLQLDAGYYVKSSSDELHFVYVVAWKPLDYLSILVVDEGDVCSELVLHATATADAMTYYTSAGLKRTLDRVHTVSWSSKEWSESSKSYITLAKSVLFTRLDVNWSIPAPLSSTTVQVAGDAMNRWFGVADSVSMVYTAKAVDMHAQATVSLRQHANESGASTGDLTGSAPMTVTFNSHPSEAVTLVEWKVIKPGNTGAYAYFTGEELEYTFKESGHYDVKVVASNVYCRDSASFPVQVYESMLDCPNFFTPRSSPGENDEFRVVYKSILSFKGVIVDRWGAVMFEWTDPSKGWDGTHGGKAVSPGVYFYNIEAKGSDGITYHKKGDINLLE